MLHRVRKMFYRPLKRLNYCDFYSKVHKKNSPFVYYPIEIRHTSKYFTFQLGKKN